MDNDLNRSVRILEESLFTSRRNVSTKSSNINKKDEEDLNLHSEKISSLFKLQNNQSAIYEETMGRIFHQDQTMMGSVIQADKPWRNAVDSLFLEFVNVMQCEDVLEIVEGLATCCSDVLKVIQGMRAQISAGEALAEEKWLENEKNTWRLLFVLYKERINLLSEPQDIDIYCGTSEKDCANNLFLKDSLIRESQLVIDWLERNALDKDDPILHRSDWTCGWEHTIHQLMAPESIAFESTTNMVKTIHPDAPEYENASLHHLDVAYEKQLNLRIFTEIRCGNLLSAQELLVSCGHPWKAAMLEGWKLYHNPNMERDPNENDCDSSNDIPDFLPSEGNARRDLWKVNALEFCKNNYLNIHERATVASFCGHLETLLAVCSSWEDYLWAYMKCLVDIRVESELRDCIARSYLPLPEEYWMQKMSLNTVFSTLETSNNLTVRREAMEANHVIQKLVILNEVRDLLKYLEQLSQDSQASTQFLRYLTHIALFFDLIGESSKSNIDNIIEAYIKRLSEMNETEILAFYVSKLGSLKQIAVYARHLEKIVAKDERKAALLEGEKYGIDVYAVTKTVVESIRNRPTQIPNQSTVNIITPEDKMKISSIDWLTFFEIQCLDALIQSNSIIFTFLTLGKIDAAHLAFEKIPSNYVKLIMDEFDNDEFTNQVVQEHLSYSAYLKGHEAFNEWFKQYQTKPQPPTNIPENAPFTEKVAHEHRVSQYLAELERWKLTTTHSAKSAKISLYNVLLFPKGWLNGRDDVVYLRSICIPEVVLLLYTILFESGLYEEAVQLADLIASETHQLYKVYTDDKLIEIMKKFAESSIALLNEKKDPFGCNLVA